MTTPLRSLGLDPGERTGWGIVDITRPRETVLAFGELDPEDPAAHLVRLFGEHQPTCVAIEVVKHVHPPRRGGVSGISTDHALMLYRAGLLAGRLQGEVLRAGIPCQLLSAEAVRGAVVGKQQASDAEIEKALRLRLINFPSPKKSNCHQRDALSAALFGGLRAGLWAAEIRRT